MSALYENLVDGIDRLVNDDLEALDAIRKEKELFIQVFERKVASGEDVTIDTQTLNALSIEERELTNALQYVLKRLQDIEHCVTGSIVFRRTKEQRKISGASDFEPSIFKRNDVGNKKEEANSNRGKTL